MAPSLVGGAPYIFRMAPPLAKRTLFVLEGRFRRRKGRRYYLEGVVMGKKAHFRVRRALLLAGGAPYLLRRAPSWAKGRLFVSEGRLRWREGAHITPSVQK